MQAYVALPRRKESDMQGSRRTGYPLWDELKPAARRMRKNATPAEAILWEGLRANRMGAKFRRQHPIGRWIADFCCPAAMLIVEVDGGVHDAQEQRDKTRSKDLEMRGFHVLRYPNHRVTSDADAVMREIALLVTQRLPQHKNAPAPPQIPSPRSGEGQG